jgi:hypothetical protein
MWRRVGRIDTDVSEEHIASSFTAEEYVNKEQIGTLLSVLEYR